jgi:hypothetical protein
MTGAAGFTGNSRNTIKITVNEGMPGRQGDAMTARAFGRRDRLMIWTVKATLLVTALTRFTAIGLRAGAKHLGQLIW